MRMFVLNIILLITITFSYGQWKSYTIYKGDTINKIDQQGRKQGLWIFFNPQYKGGIVQIGHYKNNMKEGLWTIYYPNGNIKAKITFHHNRQYGPVVLYYPNGKVNEQGYWKGNRWVGEYKYFYENGNPMYVWHYNEKGLRTGIQKYYFPNGNLYIVGTWKNGKEDGQIKEYYEDGHLKKISYWKNGQLNGKVLEYYKDGYIKEQRYYIAGIEDKSRRVIYARVKTVPERKKDSAQVQNFYYRQFSGNGNFKFFNNKGQLVSEGYFKNGVLYNGKKYYYDKNGKLIRIEVIKKGQIIDIISKENK